MAERDEKARPSIIKVTASRIKPARTYFNMVVSERTATHLPPRFTKTSIQTHFPLVSFPFAVLFSVSLPWQTATFPSTFTSIGPISNDSILLEPDLYSARKDVLVSLPSGPMPTQSSAMI
jgi:hypothetical protein